jgi:2-oxoglutarate dehydrogenase E2 component (dihydrolipoamide succinyltransferase)
MATPVTLPALGESVTEGTVTRWLKQPGDSVEVDEPLLEVSTDKVDTEIPSPVAGTLLEIKVNEDETVEVGAELATVGDSDESASAESGSSEGGEGGDAQAAESSGGTGGDSGDGANEASTQEGTSADPTGTASEQDEDLDGEADAGGESGDSGEQAAAPQPSSSSGGGGGGGGTAVTLPELGESVTEGTVTRWLKQVGDSVEVDEPLLEVSTDKVDTEIPSPVAGTLLEIKVNEDETVAVGAELASVGDESAAPAGDEQSEPEAPAAESTDDAGGTDDADEGTASEATEQAKELGEAQAAGQQDKEAEAQEEPASPAQQEAESGPAESSRSATSDGGPSASSGESSGSYVTPLVRKLASQHGVELSAVTGTGVGGRIRKQDVLEAAEQAKQPAEASAAETSAPAAQAPAPEAAEVSPLRGTTEKMSRLRKVIATRMVESLQTSAQLTTVVEVDVTAIARLRARVKDQFAAREGVKLSFLPFFAKAAIDALKTYPQLNAAIDTEKGEITYHGDEHLGVAVDTERGLLVPVIKNAGDLNIAGLSRKIADLASRTRDNKIGPDELSGGTFTLTNTGSRGALFDTPIINQPQVAILGTGSVVKRVVVVDDPNLGESIAIRQMVYLALTYDHRLVDGADAARFLTTVKKRLETASFEAELGL